LKSFTFCVLADMLCNIQVCLVLVQKVLCLPCHNLHMCKDTLFFLRT